VPAEQRGGNPLYDASEAGGGKEKERFACGAARGRRLPFPTEEKKRKRSIFSGQEKENLQCIRRRRLSTCHPGEKKHESVAQTSRCDRRKEKALARENEKRPVPQEENAFLARGGGGMKHNFSSKKRGKGWSDREGIGPASSRNYNLKEKCSRLSRKARCTVERFEHGPAIWLGGRKISKSRKGKKEKGVAFTRA